MLRSNALRSSLIQIIHDNSWILFERVYIFYRAFGEGKISDLDMFDSLDGISQELFGSLSNLFDTELEQLRSTHSDLKITQQVDTL